MIHSRIKWLHTQEDTTTKQKTIRSHNTTPGEDCRDLTKINQQRKRVGCDKVSRRSNCIEIVRKSGAAVARKKERARRFCEVGCQKVKLERDVWCVTEVIYRLCVESESRMVGLVIDFSFEKTTLMMMMQHTTPHSPQERGMSSWLAVYKEWVIRHKEDESWWCTTLHNTAPHSINNGSLWWCTTLHHTALHLIINAPSHV